MTKNENRENGSIQELLAEIKRANEQSQGQPASPYNKEYHDKLNDLVQSEIEQKDQFINWVTGIAAVGMFFIFTEIIDLSGKTWIQNTHILNFLIYTGIIFLFTLIVAAIFKWFLNVRYRDLELNVKMTGICSKGDEAMTEIKKEMSSSEILKSLKHYKCMLDFTSPSNLQKIKCIWIIEWRGFNISYYTTLAFFVIAIIATAIIFLWLIPVALKIRFC